MAFSYAQRSTTSMPSSGGAALAPSRAPVDASSWAALAALAARTPARAPDAGVRARVEHATGRDLAGARVHVGHDVDRAAHALGAEAFTVGRDVHVAGAHHRPGTPHGDRLLAHELAHVAQQGAASHAHDATALAPARDSAEDEADAVAEGRHAGPVRRTAPSIQRKTGHRQQDALGFDVAGMKTWTDTSYWRLRLEEVYTLRGTQRMRDDFEELNAITSVAWSEHLARKSIASALTKVVVLPKRGGATKELAYRLEFGPPPSTGAKATLDFFFIAEGASAAPVAAPTPSTAPAWPESHSEDRFGPAGLAGFAKAHPVEFAQLAGFVAAAPLGGFAQVVMTGTPGKTGHNSTIFVSGTKAKGGAVTGLIVRLQTEDVPGLPTIATDYAYKTDADIRLEALQKAKKDALGKIRGLDAVPAAEQVPVRAAILEYFVTSTTRDAEIDAVLPSLDGKTRVLYTLTFHGKTNDVDVARIGEQGKGDLVLDAAKRQFDVRGMYGFKAAYTSDATALRTWLATRYPAVTPTGTTAPSIITDANQKINAEAGKNDWFLRNYGTEVLDEKRGAERMKTAHAKDPKQTVDMRKFTTTDLRRMEWAFETVSDKALAALRGVPLIRQKVLIEKVDPPATSRGSAPAAPTFKEDTTTGGITLRNASDVSIVIFDNMTVNDDALFIGGGSKSGARVFSQSVAGIAHEIGHVVAWGGSGSLAIAKAFQKTFVLASSKASVDPITTYAVKSAEEYFAEAFAIYGTDPEWMQSNHKAMFDWFETLAKTGKAP